MKWARIVVMGGWCVAVSLTPARACRSSEVVFKFPPEMFELAALDAEAARAPEAEALAAVEAFYRAYASGDVASLAKWMHHDYRFLSDDPAFRLAHPFGLTSDADLAMALRIREDVAAKGGEPCQVTISHGALSLSGDPSEASVDVWVKAPVLTVVSGSEGFEVGSESHLFALVRGKSEHHAGTEWKVIRWVEFVGEPDALLADREPASLPVAHAADEEVPLTLALARAGAEPGPVLAFALALPEAGDVSLSLIDVQGRAVDRAHWTSLSPGRHVLRLAGEGASPGIYWARLVTGAERRTLRVTLVR